jgi:hypothetical protein
MLIHFSNSSILICLLPDLTNEVHDARANVDACDKQLIELRNSGVSEGAHNLPIHLLISVDLYLCHKDQIQEAQEARHIAQERYDAAFKAFMDFIQTRPMKIADVDEAEAEMSSEEVVSDEDEDDDSESASANTSGVVGGNIDAFAGDEDEDDEDDEDFKPPSA